MTTTEATYVVRVVWLRLTPKHAAIHRPECRVMNRLPATRHYATSYDISPEEIRVRLTEPGNTLGLCAFCGSREAFAP